VAANLSGNGRDEHGDPYLPRKNFRFGTHIEWGSGVPYSYEERPEDRPVPAGGRSRTA
jgi:hypothetical protein